MATTTIQVQLDQQIAQKYNFIPQEKRKTLDQLIQYLVQDFADSSPESLLELMRDMSQEAEANGLTPALLEQLLNEGNYSAGCLSLSKETGLRQAQPSLC